MLLPTLWLHDHCDPGLDVKALEERLTMTGTYVERMYAHGVTALEHFVVGRVLSAERHPDADRLTVCMVALGEGDTAQIVCGAPNVAEGQTVAVARPGAVMPGGVKLKKAKLRGVESDGMILAEDEVGIGTLHDGIMVLDDDLVPGTPLEEVLPLGTDVLELEITPNRPDCLSVYGVAREVHAATGAPLRPLPRRPSCRRRRDPRLLGRGARTPSCARASPRVLYEDVTLGESPPWLKARLMAAGQRPISNVVDITNYVMLLGGQPMHAFDADLVAGGRLVVRRARDGETMTTLDDVERHARLRHARDRRRRRARRRSPGSWAALRSEVNDATTRVLMEAANWNGPNIQRTSTRLDLRTEASGRFEKGLSPELAHGGPGAGREADGRAVRRAAGRRDDRRRRPGPRARGDAAARGARRGAARRSRSRATSRPRSSSGSASASRRPTTGSTSPCRTGGATTSRARPTSSRRSGASGATRSSRSRCRRGAG